MLQHFARSKYEKYMKDKNTQRVEKEFFLFHPTNIHFFRGLIFLKVQIIIHKRIAVSTHKICSFG